MRFVYADTSNISETSKLDTLTFALFFVILSASSYMVYGGVTKGATVHDSRRPQITWAATLLFLSLLVGCAPIDDAPDVSERVERTAQALDIFSCVPHKIYSVYAIDAAGDTSQPSWARRLVFPCGQLRLLESHRGNGCTPYGWAAPIRFSNPEPGLTPIGGYPATMSEHVRVWALGIRQVSGTARALYVTEIPAEVLRQSNGARRSYGELWQGYYDASRMEDANGWPTGYFQRWTVHAHRSLVYYADSSGRYRDEIQFGANGFYAGGLDMSTACDTVHAAMGSYIGYTSGITVPWTPVRYATCSPEETMYNARPVLSTSGVNPHNVTVTDKGTVLGWYIDGLTNEYRLLDRAYPYYEPNNSSVLGWY